jgi:hypothetical protein
MWEPTRGYRAQHGFVAEQEELLRRVALLSMALGMAISLVT